MSLIVKDNFISQESFDEIYRYALSLPESGWSLMNEPEINGEFWDNKRAMIPPELVTELQESIFQLELSAGDYSAINKIQRFYSNDRFGPIVDQEHVPDLKFGIAYFLNDLPGSGIVFTNLNAAVKAKKNTLVVYDAAEEYFIDGPTPIGSHMLFMTFFAS